MKDKNQILTWTAGAGGFVIVALVIFLHILLDRTDEFRIQAKRGQPIVRAIDSYRKDVGRYPVSLSVLIPKYLSQMPDTSYPSGHKFDGWEYRVIVNLDDTTYTLRYYMGRGGVEYEPPVWYGNNEGSRKVLIRNR
jgi:hypothetical protein